MPNVRNSPKGKTNISVLTLSDPCLEAIERINVLQNCITSHHNSLLSQKFAWHCKWQNCCWLLVSSIENALFYDYFSEVIQPSAVPSSSTGKYERGSVYNKTALHFTAAIMSPCIMRAVAVIRFGFAISRTSAGLIKIPVFQMLRYCDPMI